MLDFCLRRRISGCICILSSLSEHLDSMPSPPALACCQLNLCGLGKCDPWLHGQPSIHPFSKEADSNVGLLTFSVKSC